MQHCIVTPDTIGPVKNGGIGTHCYNLARYLAQQGHTVTLLFTTHVQECHKQRWVKLYLMQGVTLLYLQDMRVKRDYFIPLAVDLLNSLKVYEFLKTQFFDQIHFQDLRANGFHTIQAKHTLGILANTRLTVTLHSSTEWINQGMERWNPHHTDGTKLMWSERYAVEHCDTVISPSAYMLEWIQQQGWKVPRDARVLPNIFVSEMPQTEYSEQSVDIETVAFFGRLETRKGLGIFCNTLKRLPAARYSRIKKVLFIGSIGMVGNVRADVYIASQLQKMPFQYILHTNLDSFAAQKLLIKEKALTFIPSLVDNFPYTVLECACQHLPVLASNIGGIPEILPPEQLFEPSIAGITAAIIRVQDFGFPLITKHTYTVQHEPKGWQNIACEPLQSIKRADCTLPPLVSVCMPHYNHGRYLQAAIQSLVKQEYTNFEVIITDDGSTDSQSQLTFTQVQNICDSRFHFFSKHNEGPSITRNYCVEKSRGQFLMFVDADNIFPSNMLLQFVKSMQQTNVDVITCHACSFPAEGTGDTFTPLYGFAPIGQDIVSGILENVFGDTNFMIKSEVFNALGGFAQTEDGCEDWEFLARLALQGYTQDVIPEPLLWYRHTHDGMRANMSKYKGQQLVLSAYKQHLPVFAGSAFENILIPMFSGHSVSNAVIIRSMLRLGVYFEEKYTKFFPCGSCQQRFVSFLWGLGSRFRNRTA